MLPESINVLMLVVAVFERLRIPYLVGGSMASALYGVARSTLDADVVADIRLMDLFDHAHQQRLHIEAPLVARMGL